MNMISKAENYATQCHKEEFRRDGITPYINHCKDVAKRTAEALDKDGMKEFCVETAWLHDVCENCGIAADDLVNAGFPTEVIIAVTVLTKSPGQDYFEYLEKVKENPIARRVKIHDMLANLADNPSKKQVKKYADGLTFLLNGII